MIEVKLMGRLGNHLFQYAFAYSLARELGTSFKIKGMDHSPLPSLCSLPSYKPARSHTERFPLKELRIREMFKK
ncbi:MAG: hypothetical protein AAGA85_05220, partial [Bacteroidota bacterium]